MIGRLRVAGCVALALLVAGCGGGGGTSPSTPPASAAKTQSGTLSLTFGTQTGSTSATRKPAFVSAGAMSAAVDLDSGQNAFFDVSASSSLCTTTSGTRTCAIALVAPVGYNTVVVSLYDGANGSGHLLSTGSMSFTVTAGTPFSATVGLNPAIATLASFAYTTGGIFALGTPSTATVLLTFADPSGTQITGSGNVPNFITPVTLTSSDPSITFSPTTLTTPGQQFTMTYNGATPAHFPVTLGASVGTTVVASSTLPFSAPFNAPEGIAFDTSGNLYVANSGANELLQIPAASLAVGAPAPQTKLLLALGGYLSNPARLAFDPRSTNASDLWVASIGSGYSANGDVAEYNATTGLSLLVTYGSAVAQPLGIAVDGSGYLYVGNNAVSAQNVTVFTPPGYTTTQTITGWGAGSCAAGTFSNVNALNYFGNVNGVQVATGPNTVDFNATNFAAGSPTCVSKANLSITIATAVAAANVAGVPTLYVGDGGSNTLSSFNLLSPASPLLQVALPAGPQGLAVDAGGNVYVSIPTFDEILEFNSSLTQINRIY